MTTIQKQDHWARKREILAQLTHQQFVSGEQIASHCGISRAAVQQYIEALKDYGVSIFSVKGKGYKLEKPIFLTDENQLKAAIKQRCFYFDEIDSTNSFLLKQASQLSSGDFCLAEYQTAGRGRFNRQWISPYANNLYFSFFWNFPKGLDQAMGLSLVIGCSLVRALEAFNLVGLGLKWPNDVYLQGRKLAGILIELARTEPNRCEFVIGVGLNLAMNSDQAISIDQPWNDLSEIAEQFDKTEFVIQFHQQLMQDLTLFNAQGLAPFMQRWQQMDIYHQQLVTIHQPNQVIEGVCLGIDPTGNLLLQTANGLESFIGGEVSLRSA